MNGFNPYLADVYAAMSLPPANASQMDPSADVMLTPPPPQPPGAPPELAPAGPPLPPAPIASQPQAPMMSEGPLMSEQPPAPPPPPAGPPPAAPNVGPSEPQGQAAQFPLSMAGGGGVVPAHEVDLRGPTLKAQQGVMNAAAGEAIGRNTDNSRDAAAHEYAQALNQERDARAREAATQQSMAERDEELATRQQDFTSSVKALSKASVDPDRFWASRSTGQKIGVMISLALGGFVQGVRGGSNPGMDIINNAIERDIKAQEFAYHATRDTAAMKQTAFGLAMQKYQNVDAARSMARAASLDAVQAQFGQNAALWKDAESANRANGAMAELEGNKAQQIAQGIRFLPATATGGQFVDKYGVTYSNKDAQGVAKDFRSAEEERKKQVAGIGGQLLVEGAKGEAAAQKDVRAEMVTLPNGEELRAPNAQEATKLRDISSGVNGAQQLVAEALAIRQGTAWRVRGTSANERLHQIQGELQVSTKDRAGLGALSGPDMGLVNTMIGDLTSQSPVANKTLESFQKHTNDALRSRVKTIPGAPTNAKGELSAEAQKSLGGYAK